MAGSVAVRGPLFDGQADAAVDRALRETRKSLAEEGAEMLRTFPMNRSGRSRGGFRDNIHVVSRGTVEALPGPQIRGVVFSPWLEGTSRRNETTRFPGYHLFRATRERLDRKARTTAEARLARHIGEMGGV